MHFKSMIERCIQRMRRGDCATCERKNVCGAARWQQAFAVPAGVRPPSPEPKAPVANPLLAFLGEVAKAIERGVTPPKKSFRSEVERQLEPLLTTGAASIDQVARALGSSRQTLYRRLKAEGVTFEQVLDELRRKLALRYMREEGLGVKQAAYRLGFSDPSAFSRAFKRWTGQSPSALRS